MQLLKVDEYKWLKMYIIYKIKKRLIKNLNRLIKKGTEITTYYIVKIISMRGAVLNVST